MTWQCVLLPIVGTHMVDLEPPPGGGISGETRLLDAEGREYCYDDLPPGSMFEVPQGVEFDWPWYWAKEENLSDYYRQNNASRQPLLCILPGRHLFSVDGKCWSDGKSYGGWTVTGTAPLITVSPSINIGGSYHGWLQNGVISNDCEGRQFDALGHRR